jgi:hypothetical protein
MSIATLKRKTQTKYNNMSVNTKEGFSLNGTRRLQGYVGQTSLSRSLPRTLMRGQTIRGHGGCCGTYLITPIIQSSVTTTEDSTVLKSSVLNTRGMLANRFSCDPCNIVTKPSYIKSNRETCIDTSALNGASCVYTPVTIQDCTIVCKNKTVRESHTKPVEYYTTMSSSDRLKQLQNRLEEKMILLYVPVSGKLNRGEPYAC